MASICVDNPLYAYDYNDNYNYDIVSFSHFSYIALMSQFQPNN